MTVMTIFLIPILQMRRARPKEARLWSCGEGRDLGLCLSGLSRILQGRSCLEAPQKSHLRNDNYFTDHRSLTMIDVLQMLSALGTVLRAVLLTHYCTGYSSSSKEQVPLLPPLYR